MQLYFEEIVQLNFNPRYASILSITVVIPAVRSDTPTWVIATNWAKRNVSLPKYK